MNRKHIWLAASALILSAVLFTGCGSSATDPAAGASSGAGVAPVGSPSSNLSAGMAGSASSDYITEQEAKEIALKNAGLAEEEVQFRKARLDYDDNRAQYDIEFLVGNEEYDYDIDATTGEILSMDRDIEDWAPSAQTNQETASSQAPAATGEAAPKKDASGDSSAKSSTSAAADTQTASGTYIGEEAAQKAALDHAGVSKDSVKFVRTHLERDDGRWKYEVEFYQDNTEYDYDIDAVSGEILSYDHDAEYYTAPSGTEAGAAALTADEAKQIALKHAGVAESDVQRLKVEQDRDDGRLLYEVEWDVGRTEYSYEIDANTGDILNYEKDVD